MTTNSFRLGLGILALASRPTAIACGDATQPARESIGPVSRTASFFDLDRAPGNPDTFLDLPWTSDLRLSADGRPVLDGFPGRGNGIVGPALRVADRRTGFAETWLAGGLARHQLPVGVCCHKKTYGQGGPVTVTLTSHATDTRRCPRAIRAVVALACRTRR